MMVTRHSMLGISQGGTDFWHVGSSVEMSVAVPAEVATNQAMAVPRATIAGGAGCGVTTPVFELLTSDHWYRATALVSIT